MPSSAELNFDPVTLAKQIIDLNADVYRNVDAGKYELAAALRDQRELLQRRLDDIGSPTIVHNVKRMLRSGLSRAPVLSMLAEGESPVDAELFRRMSEAPLPPRWLLNESAASCRAS